MGRAAAIVVLAAFSWCTSAACYTQPCPAKPSCSRSKKQPKAPAKASAGCHFLAEQKWQDAVAFHPDLFPPAEAPAIRTSRAWPEPEPRARGDDPSSLLHLIQVLRI